MKLFTLYFCLIFIVNLAVSQQQKVDKNTGFIDFNGYYDTREFSVLTINMMVNFPNCFQYFSLTNYEGQSTSSDLGNLYSEHNLRYPLSRKLAFKMNSTITVSSEFGKGSVFEFTVETEIDD